MQLPSFATAVTAVIARDDGTTVVVKEPLAGLIISVILSMASIAILSCFITIRSRAVKSWTALPYVQWLVFCIYYDSFTFVIATAILQFGLGVNSSLAVCESAILICLIFYVTTKILIYLFLVEKAHIIRASSKKGRLNSKLYLFNSFGMMGLYMVVVVLNFVFRITRMEEGVCIIGMKRLAMIPLIAFDLLVNVYLTILFLIPLSSLYTFKNFQKTPANNRLKTIAFRTFLGSCCTLISSIVNLSVLMALDGEPGWVCLMCCNCDVLFSAIVLQWVTSPDSAQGDTSASLSNHHTSEELGTVSRKRGHVSVNDEHRHTATDTALRRAARDRRLSDTSNESSHVASSTKAIVEDIGEISRDSRRRSSADCQDTPRTGGKMYYGEDHARAISTGKHEVDREDGRGDHTVSPLPQVHVHVDYKVTQKAANAVESAMGNTVVIGTGLPDDGRRSKGNVRGMINHNGAM